MKRVAVLGVGSYAMALSYLLDKKGYSVLMWTRDQNTCDSINNLHKNPKYLQQITFSKRVRATLSLEEAACYSNYLVNVLPTQHIRELIKKISHLIDNDTIIINGSKGIEAKSLLTISELLEEILPPRLHRQLVFISGPTFAKELAEEKITAAVVASHSRELCKQVMKLFSVSYFKLYTSRDVMGIELCGALKNIIAIAGGIVDGLSLGKNALSAVITGGLTEISRIGIRKGANLGTFIGLAGVGDLVLTCTGDLSRNRHVGRELASGKELSFIIDNMSAVAEGVETTLSAYKLAKQLKVKVPIIDEVYNVLYKDKDLRQAITNLLGKELHGELGESILAF